MFSAALYARTRYLLSIAYETAGAARIRHSLRPLIGEGGSYLQTSGEMRCENAKLILRHPRATASPSSLEARA